MFQTNQLKLHSSSAPSMDSQQEEQSRPIQPNIDQEKLQQAIMSFKQQSPLFQAQMQNNMQRPQHYPSPLPLYHHSPWGAPLYAPQPWSGPIPAPFASPYSAQPIPGPQYYPQAYYPGAGRISRDMDYRDRQHEVLAASRVAQSAAVSAGAHNITCVMQELGYLDENLEPNVEKIARRISGLPVHRDLKEDMLEGLDYCQKFSVIIIRNICK
ncbi:uncharacterized protein LOC113370145 [Ctenocephalides felis]|uniref:uncharacterized protein LOC113370145 n=1 Tax=Ctenocephalides felis TaxID=7515 RepID=UPI000E6E582E|nr:uncharacterized protein LOC113370145 [Ctenocephalides felis]